MFSSCAREVTRPDSIANQGPPDLRAEEGFLYWPSLPIGVVGRARDPGTVSFVTPLPTRVGTTGPATHEQNIVVTGTGCLPAVRQSCVGSFRDYRIQYYIDDVLWWDRASSATSGWQSFFGLPWTPADTGLHTIRVVLDATNRYAENDETETSFQVRVILGDLVSGMIEAIEWRDGYPHRVSNVRAGTPVDSRRSFAPATRSSGVEQERRARSRLDVHLETSDVAMKIASLGGPPGSECLSLHVVDQGRQRCLFRRRLVLQEIQDPGQ